MQWSTAGVRPHRQQEFKNDERQIASFENFMQRIDFQATTFYSIKKENKVG